MSIKEAEKIIAGVSRSLSVGDYAVIQTMSQDQGNVESHLKNAFIKQFPWQEVTNSSTVRSFYRDYGVALEDEMRQGGLEVHLDELAEGLTEKSNFTQRLTFYSESFIKSILNRYGLDTERVLQSVCRDGYKRITILAKKCV